MKGFFFYLALALAFATSAQRAAAEGGGFEHGNAGDAYSAEFILTARDLAQRMMQQSPIVSQWVDIRRLSGAILTTKVRSEANLQLNGHTVDAINKPDESMIIINRDRWRDYRSPLETKARLTLVLHEYLGVIGSDDGQYQITGRILSFLNVQNYSPGTWWNPLNPVNYVSLSLVSSPENCSLQSLKFNPSLLAETATAETTGKCGTSYRKVVIAKTSAMAPPSEQIKGIFHRYDVRVFDSQAQLIHDFSYVPEWGRCVLPEDGTCRLSGQLDAGGVEFVFWYQRN